MNKLLGIMAICLLAFSSIAFAASEKCTTIQSGTLLASDGSVITTGFDRWGYNYQARMFSGLYCDSYRDADWCKPYADVNLEMKWNDAWLSNQDCNGDKLLDRHYGFESYIGSGAWLTNHQSGEYEQDGEVCKWNYFVKIVAVPSDATLAAGYWYTVDGTEIGPAIWGEFAIIQEVSNDDCTGDHGRLYVSPDGAGLGHYAPEKITFINYADGRHEQIGGPAATETEGCYKVISKDMEWKVSPDYTISVADSFGVTELEFVAAVESAISEWNNPTLVEDTAFIDFGTQTVDSTQPTGIVNDGINTISFGNYETSGVIAVCSVWGVFRGPPASRYISQFDVMMDTDWDWGDGGVDQTKMDLQNILTHELGHATGLADLYTSDCTQETMFGYSQEGDIHARDLYYGDIAGLNLLYSTG